MKVNYPKKVGKETRKKSNDVSNHRRNKNI